MHAVIDADQAVYTLINTFDVGAESSSAVVESLRDFTEHVTRSLAGFVSTSVHVSVDRTRVVNYVQWRSEEHFAAMFRLPETQAHLREVGALAKQVTPVTYQVAYVGGRPNGNVA